MTHLILCMHVIILEFQIFNIINMHVITSNLLSLIHWQKRFILCRLPLQPGCHPPANRRNTAVVVCVSVCVCVCVCVTQITPLYGCLQVTQRLSLCCAGNISCTVSVCAYMPKCVCMCVCVYMPKCVCVGVCMIMNYHNISSR